MVKTFFNHFIKITKSHIICCGRGRIEKFAVLAEYSEDIENSAIANRYDIETETEIIFENFEKIGFITSVAESNKLGTTVAIGTFTTERQREKVFYKNLNWKHWRVATVKNIESNEILF